MSKKSDKINYYKADLGYFSLNLPVEWENQTIYTIKGPEDSGMQHNLIIQEENELEIQNLETYADNKISALKNLSGFELLSSKERRLKSGLEAWESVYKWIPFDGKIMYQKQVYLIVEKRGYTITSSFSKKTLKTVGSVVDQIIDAFEPKKLPPKAKKPKKTEDNEKRLIIDVSKIPETKTKFTVKSNTPTTIVLKSSILEASLLNDTAYIGGKVGFKIKTLFVGEGGTIKIIGKSENGAQMEPIIGSLFGNQIKGEFKIPLNIKPKDKIYFEVVLPDHDLKTETKHIPVAPPIKVTNMRWNKNTTHHEEVLKLTADVEGVHDSTDANVIIYKYDEDDYHEKLINVNREIKNKKLELDWEFRYFEDRDEIPTEKELQKFGKHYTQPQYFFVIEIDGQRFGNNQESGLLKLVDSMTIDLKNTSGESIGNVDYVLHLPDGSKRKGKLDENGYAREDNLPPGRTTVEFPKIKKADINPSVDVK